MLIKDAEKITHTLSKPGKMPGFAYSTPAHECKTGTKLRAIPNSVCANCYAYKRGRYRFQNVIDAQYKRFRALTHPLWVEAMAAQINSKKVKHFRWHDSGDVQNLDHLNKIYEVCRLTPSVKHWMPTREAWTKDHLSSCPDNLIIRFSVPMIDQEAPVSWPHTSTVTTKPGKRTCPAPTQGNQCKDCRACWDKTVKIFVMANIKKFPRGISDQAISLRAHDGERERAPDSGLKPKSYVWYFHNHKWKQRYDPSAKQQAPSSKPHAPIFRKLQASSAKLRK